MVSLSGALIEKGDIIVTIFRALRGRWNRRGFL